MTIYTTLEAIRAKNPCRNGWEKLLKSLGKTQADDEPLPLVRILESNGIDDALWCLRALPDDMDNTIRLYNADVAELALPMWTERYPNDDRPAKAIQAARDYVNGLIKLDDMIDARDAARDAARAAAWAAARAAAWAAAMAAARDAAGAAAMATAGDAAMAAARAAAWAVAMAAAMVAKREAQRELFIKYFG